jgi:hypothetical protein
VSLGPVIVLRVTFRDVMRSMLKLAGPEAIGAVGIGSILFLALAIFGMGLLLGLPIGYTLCFRSGWGVIGLWVG